MARTAELKRMTALKGRVVKAPEVGPKPALAAPAGAKAEDVGNEEVVVGVPPEGRTVRGVDEGVLGKHEVSLLLPTVIVPLQASFPAASSRERTT